MTRHSTIIHFKRKFRVFRVMAVAMTAVSLPTIASSQTGTMQASDAEAPTVLEAEKMSGRPDREVVLERDAEVTRGATTLNADTATYDVIKDEVEAVGNIRIKRFGDRYTGDEMKMKMDSGQGYVLNPTYKLELNNAQGKAERIDFISRDEANVIDGTYSTCEGPDPDWYLRADTLSLDKARDRGTTSTTVVYFKGVPILGSPFLTFPLSDARKSGFLPPTIGTTSRGGFEAVTPYYFNIAPNRDLTLYPRIMTKRGVQLGAQGRYLGETYSGETRVEGMLNDRLTGDKRYAISSTHVQSFSSGLVFSSNLNAASDDDYPNDFSSSITAASQRLLLRDIGVSYAGSFWNASARATNYQVLQDPRAPIARPYDRLPQISFSAGRQDVKGFDWRAGAELTSFNHPTLAEGERFVVNPRISFPIIDPGYFITPSASLHASTYKLSRQVPGARTSVTRVLPTISIDSGLIFEREASFLGREATQTLEPRLFYVRTPYRYQKDIPLFDTALADFNFSQIFSENIYSGNDRISDANQLTAAVVSRYIETSGIERMRFALAQRYYFSPQRVIAEDLGRTPSDNRSDLLLAAAGQVTPTVGIDANIQYSQSLRTVSRATYGVRWQPGPKRVLNVQYRRDLTNPLNINNNFELADLSGQWPIADRWYAVGRVNYALKERKVAESLFGLEYKADCWVFRMVGQRTPTATGVAATALFLQLELNGLSKIGSNPLEALRTNVPGYQIVN